MKTLINFLYEIEDEHIKSKLKVGGITHIDFRQDHAYTLRIEIESKMQMNFRYEIRRKQLKSSLSLSQNDIMGKNTYLGFFLITDTLYLFSQQAWNNRSYAVSRRGKIEQRGCVKPVISQVARHLTSQTHEHISLKLNERQIPNASIHGKPKTPKRRPNSSHMYTFFFKTCYK